MHASCLCDTAKAAAFETEWISCNDRAWFQLKLWALSLLSHICMLYGPRLWVAMATL